MINVNDNRMVKLYASYCGRGFVIIALIDGSLHPPIFDATMIIINTFRSTGQILSWSSIILVQRNVCWPPPLWNSIRSKNEIFCYWIWSKLKAFVSWGTETNNFITSSVQFEERYCWGSWLRNHTNIILHNPNCTMDTFSVLHLLRLFLSYFLKIIKLVWFQTQNYSNNKFLESTLLRNHLISSTISKIKYFQGLIILITPFHVKYRFWRLTSGSCLSDK